MQFPVASVFYFWGVGCVKMSLTSKFCWQEVFANKGIFRSDTFHHSQPSKPMDRLGFASLLHP